MRLGAHVSIAGGVYKAPARGEKIGCSAIQIFTKNQLQWRAKELSPEEINKFKNELTNSSIKSILAHDSYLINLGSPDPKSLEKSRASFSVEMQRAEALGIPYLVFHPGAHLNSGEGQGLTTIAESLNLLLSKHHAFKLILLLENTAGQGSALGNRFAQLATIFQMIDDDERIGVCFDTAHAFVAGYDMRTRDAYEHTFDEFDRILGIERLKAFHLNDSKKELGSRVDRHEHIGKGLIGLHAFQLLVNDARFYEIPKVLEIPGTENDFQDNLNLLKSLIAKE